MDRRTFLITVSLVGVVSLAGLTGCFGVPAKDGGGNVNGGSNVNGGGNVNSNSGGGNNTASYQQVDAKAAKELMDAAEDRIILDVRTQDEYDEGHIPGAILIPHDTVANAAEDSLPNKDQLILVYCRSGNRSKQASQVLANLGYTNVVEFGGINNWPYEVE